MDRYYRIEEAAKILNTKISTVRTYCREGRMPAVKVGRGYRIAKEDLERWIRLRRQDSTSYDQEQQRLVEAEAKYKDLFEHASDAIVLFDVKGNLTLANPKAYELFGYTPEEAKGTHFARFVYTEDLPLVTERFMLRMAGEDVPNQYEIRMLHKDGQVIPAEISSSLLMKEGTAEGVQIIIRDSSERKKAEAAVKESRERYRTLFEESPISLWEEDFSELKTHIDSLVRKGVKDVRAYFDKHPEEVTRLSALVKAVDVNRATLRLYKARSKKELLDDLGRVFCEESYEGFKEGLVAIAEGKTEYRMETVNKTLKGDTMDISLKWSRAPESGTRAIVSIIDITDRKKAEEALQRSEEQLKAQYKNIPVPTYTWQRIGNSFVLTDYNDAAAVFTAGNVKHFLGKEAKAMYSDRPDILEDLLKCFDQRAFFRRKMPYTFQATGEEKHLEVSYVFVPPDLVMVHTDDITERKKVEEELQESEEMYRMLVEASPEAVTVTDLEGNITHVSEQTLRLFGYKSAKELLGRNGMMLVKPEEHEKAQENIQKVRKQGIQKGARYALIRADGSGFIGQVNAALVRDADGQPKAFITTTREVAEGETAQ